MTTKKIEKKNKVEIEKLAGSEVKLSIIIPKETFNKHVETATKSLASEMKMDGFRNGKVPKEVVEKTVGTEKIVYQAAEEAVREGYVNAILDNKIDAIGEPRIDIKKIAKGNDFEFTATVGVLPEIELGNWEKGAIKINKKFSKEEIKVEEKEIDHEVKYLAEQRAKIVTVNRAVKKGDQVEIDFDVFLDNVAIENGSAKKHVMLIGDGKFIPGFEDNLIGMKAGDEKDFKLAFPKEYHAKHLAGKEAEFKVKLNLVQEKEIAKIDDDFAKSIGEFKSLKSLKENIEKGISQEKKRKNDDEHKKELIESIIETMKVEVPEVLLEREMDIMMGELEADISRMGIDKEGYFKQVKTTEEKVKEGWKENAAPKRVKAALILQEIAKQEKFVPDTKEIEEKVNQTLEYYQTIGTTDDKIDTHRLYEATKGSLANEMVFKFLMEVK
ncbi:trigger factor [bacterium]|jgi:trigger factor|nr:trigger factor [bacterium]MBT4251499.1 trigger factor [bacterium]MBT4597473.1 trigger factor [bacterium]MBT6754312.1 trigger factor [bacterium]MBT7037638.1 trigger factor [bacterium]